jgi:hypothetical protein
MRRASLRTEMDLSKATESLSMRPTLDQSSSMASVRCLRKPLSLWTRGCGEKAIKRCAMRNSALHTPRTSLNQRVGGCT